MPGAQPPHFTLGIELPQVNHQAKVLGRAQYAGDIKMPGMLHGAILRSPYAHARIVSIDTSAALALPGSLPLGTQRLVEIARALAADPVLLMLDEPAAGLRLFEKQALSQLLDNLRTEGVTVLIVEHDMEFVMSLVDRLVVMNFGSKIFEGKPAEARADAQVQQAYLGGEA